MRFFARCDICLKEYHCKGMRLPKQLTLVEGMDLCEECHLEYEKRKRKILRDLAREKAELK